MYRKNLYEINKVVCKFQQIFWYNKKICATRKWCSNANNYIPADILLLKMLADAEDLQKSLKQHKNVLPQGFS